MIWTPRESDLLLLLHSTMHLPFNRWRIFVYFVWFFPMQSLRLEVDEVFALSSCVFAPWLQWVLYRVWILIVWSSSPLQLVCIGFAEGFGCVIERCRHDEVHRSLLLFCLSYIKFWEGSCSIFEDLKTWWVLELDRTGLD